MILLQRVVACRCDNAIIHVLQQLVQTFYRILSDLINESFSENNTGKIELLAVLDFILYEHLHDEELSHRGRCGIAESVIIQLIVDILLRNEEPHIFLCRNGQIVTYECSERLLLQCGFGIAGLINSLGDFRTTEVSDTRKDGTGIIPQLSA